MIVQPYKRPPMPPRVGLLLRDGQTVLSEGGETFAAGRSPADMRVWVSFDTVRELVAAQVGEALCWRGEELRWRTADHDGGNEWKPRATDAIVVKLPLDEEFPVRTVLALARWRDWLGSYGAAPGSMGSASWSLLRATLTEELRTSSPVGQRPPLRQTIGGRQHVGTFGRGRFLGRVELLDLPAAYASCLGGMLYGGRWRRASELNLYRHLDWWSADGRPCFVRAKVRLSADPPGALPKRPTSRFDPAVALGLGCEYPTTRTMQGFWTVEELRAAEEHGAKILRVLDVWGHFAGGRRPFAPWWEAVERGRSMPGLAGLLAKTTGNALWGRFCMDTRMGRKTIRRDGRTHHVKVKGGIPPAHDLAETVSGRVRADLYRLLATWGDDVLSAHTDGAWVRNDERRPVPAGWRRKARASCLDLLGPQTLRYTPTRGRNAGEPVAVVSGVPYRQADAVFEEQWNLYLNEWQPASILDRVEAVAASPALQATLPGLEEWVPGG